MQIIVHGATGRMGQNLLKLIEQNPGHTLAAAVSPELETCPERQAYHSLADYQGPADMIVDFSHHSAVGALLDYAEARQIPVVIGTTGHTGEEKARIAEAAGRIPVFQSGNMSVGVALLVQLARQTAQAFPDAEIEIVEIHHDQKLDVPSGTALMLYEAAKKEKGPETEPVFGRYGRAEKRTCGEIGIHAVRGGTVTGEHEVGFYGNGEELILTHRAENRALFAQGALRAARYLMDRPAGLYSMRDVVREMLG